MRNSLLLITLIISVNFSFGMTEIDSIQHRLNVVENELYNQKRQLELDKKELKLDADKHKAELDKQFTTLSNDLTYYYNLIKILSLLFAGLTVGSVITLYIKARKYALNQIKEKFDYIITQEEANILDVVEKHDVEKQILKSKRILVLTSDHGDDIFLRNFFKTMEFGLDKVDYTKVSEYSPVEDYDLIFANNEVNDLDKNLIDQYFESSDKKTVLFYYNTTGTMYRNNNVSERLSFANSPTQIYGNMINLLRFQSVIRN